MVNIRSNHYVNSFSDTKISSYIWNNDQVKEDLPLFILVHQYSKMGGCSQLMDSLAYKLLKIGYIVISFDQRGVGKSEGSSTFNGSDEVNDVISICNWTHQLFPHKNIILLGSSAGSTIAGRAIDLPFVYAYVAIGYTFGWLSSWLFSSHYPSILNSSKPKLFIMGSEDGFTSLSCFHSYFSQMKEPKFSHIIKGVGHFELECPDYDNIIIEVIKTFLSKINSNDAESKDKEI